MADSEIDSEVKRREKHALQRDRKTWLQCLKDVRHDLYVRTFLCNSVELKASRVLQQERMQINGAKMACRTQDPPLCHGSLLTSCILLAL